MGTTLTHILLHITFSTKYREPSIPIELLEELFAVIGGICRDRQCALLCAGGVADHVHLMVSLGKTTAVADLMQHIKRGSSVWLNWRVTGRAAFAWQDGYFAFSVSDTHADALRAYIDGQAEHHRAVGFKEEVESFLRKYNVAYDAKYLWD